MPIRMAFLLAWQQNACRINISQRSIAIKLVTIPRSKLFLCRRRTVMMRRQDRTKQEDAMIKTRLTLVPCLLLFSLFSTATWAEKVEVSMRTSMGEIRMSLDKEKAPKTVENFIQYVKDGFYDGTIFHRVIKGFMIQGGGFTEAMEKKQTRDPIQNEAKNGLKNRRGTIAMARTSAPHSATAQFFINHKDNDFLDYPSRDGWGYAVFGEVTQGMDVVDKIADQSTGVSSGMRDVPESPIIIEKVTVLD
jgi:cyclophilin family peptidyl-prolyl cis-trans isomerase